MRPLLLLLLFFTFGCVKPNSSQQVTSMMGYAPVYLNVADIKTIEAKAARTTQSPGKIYVYQQWLFQVDQFTGIHIIDNSTPAQARKIGFLQVPGATELAIKGGYLYTNNGNDLVVFSLTNPAAPQLVQRLENAFPKFSADLPPVGNVYFECPDPAKGVVVSWQEKLLDNPKCRR